MATVSVRRGDRLPWLGYQFGFSLEDAVSVSFSARDKSGDVVFIDNQAAVIANGTYSIAGQDQTFSPADGVVFYQWQEADVTTERAACEGLFHITWPGPLQQTQPADGYIAFRIRENF